MPSIIRTPEISGIRFNTSLGSTGIASTLFSQELSITTKQISRMKDL